MFGTLVSSNFGQGSLEFVQNQDPSDAVNFNIRRKVHVSCTFCRARKVGCSGERSGCERCTTMGLECVYPAHWGRIKRQGKPNGCSSPNATQHDANAVTQPAGDSSELHSREGLSLGNLHNITFDNEDCLDKSLFESWVMNSTAQDSPEGGLASRNGSIDTPSLEFTTSEMAFSLQNSSPTVALLGHQPELSTIGTPSTSSGGLSSAYDLGEKGLGDDVCTGPDGDTSWGMSANGHSTTGPSPEALSLEPWGKTCPRLGSCRCLLSSISFLERLVSGAASGESRPDRLLADVREAIETLTKFMACERCVARVELNLVLAMATQQISVTCGKIANYYQAMQMATSADDKGSSSGPQQRTGVTSSTESAVDIFVSTYRVNHRERLHLLKSLVKLQIADLTQHVNTMMWRHRNQPNPGQAGALRKAKNHIKLAQTAISGNS
ncbi:hypothetical protein F4808DRAFT_415544 [Astrocystis sublimbata]|nr:hypothetical protein F4808DRAFT_415544 [Astrocystis sublimbata]